MAADPADPMLGWSVFFVGTHMGYGTANVSGVSDSEDFNNPG